MAGEEAREASAWLEKCRLSLQQFANQVFEYEDPDHSHKMRFDPGAIQPKGE